MSDNRKRSMDSLVNNSGCQIKLITQKNLIEHVLPEFPLHEAFNYLSETHKSDYLRCYFMRHFGGGYADIKQFDFNWEPWFDRMRDTDIWATGYEEVGHHGVAAGARNRQVLLENYKSLIGTSAYIFRKDTELTGKWYGEVSRKLDNLLPKLLLNPSKHPQDILGRKSEYLLLRKLRLNKSKYPVAWTELLGDIFHPLVYKYTDHIDKTLPAPNWHTPYR